jgi:malate dehydrogenase (oxaloacetate-decarboxylating)
MPVMEGKALLFKTLRRRRRVPDLSRHEGSRRDHRDRRAPRAELRWVNLEDIAAPNCFYVEEELKKRVDIPIFHDDQHGTAVVTLARSSTRSRSSARRWKTLYVVIAGVGAAGVACAKILMSAGVQNIVGCDRQGRHLRGARQPQLRQGVVRENSNPSASRARISEVMTGADVFIGVSGPG